MVEIIPYRLPALLFFVVLLALALRALVSGGTGRASVTDKAFRHPEEKRRASRSKIDVRFDLADGNGGFKPDSARLLDISVWGACITSGAVFSRGQAVHGRVRTASEPPVKIAGRVVWVQRNGASTFYGIAFDQTTRL